MLQAAALIASGQQARIGDLYQHLLRQPDDQSTGSRQRLVRRSREATVKCIILNGIPIVMEGFQSLAKVEQPEDQDHSFTKYDKTPLACLITSQKAISSEALIQKWVSLILTGLLAGLPGR